MSHSKPGFPPDEEITAPVVDTAHGHARSPLTVAVMGRAVLVELTHGFDLLLLVLESGPVAHVCHGGRVIARLPMSAC